MRRGFNILQLLSQRGERILIRAMILASLALVVAQLGSAKDPVAFYLAMAGKVESPALDVPAESGGSSTSDYSLVLQAVPGAPVKVWQNGKQIGDLLKGEQSFKVQKGQILLDGRGINQPVRVQVLRTNALQEPRLNQTFIIQGNIQAVEVAP